MTDELNKTLASMALDGSVEINGDVVSLPQDQVGSFLCDVRFYRDPRGRIRAELTDMLPGHVEGAGETIKERFNVLASWLEEGAASFRLQSYAFDDDEVNQ